MNCSFFLNILSLFDWRESNKKKHRSANFLSNKKQMFGRAWPNVFNMFERARPNIKQLSDHFLPNKIVFFSLILRNRAFNL